MCGMNCAKALGHERHDGCVAVGDYHRIRSGLEQTTEFCLGAFPLGDVMDQRRHSQHSAAVVDKRSVVPLARDDACALSEIFVCVNLASFRIQQLSPNLVYSGTALWRNNEVSVLADR